jgi:hypothetical protein
MEEECRAKLRAEEDWLRKLEDHISKQRDSDCKEPRGLEIANIRLDETNVRLGQVRAKLQYLLSSITTIESSKCDLRSRPHFSATSNKMDYDSNIDKLKDHCQRQWSLQLCEVMDRLLFLRAKCEQDNINTETLQHRANAYLKVVSMPDSEYYLSADVGLGLRFAISKTARNIRVSCQSHRVSG